MRKQIDGLAALVRDGMGHNPLDGGLYLFAGMGGRRLKALYWDRNGFCLWQKRLEEDRFPWPGDTEAARAITVDQLTMLLDGIDFWRAHQRRDYQKIG
jgi:transposase